MKAEMMTVALIYGLLLLMHYQVVNRLPRRKKLAPLPHRKRSVNTRERLRTRVRARIGSKTS